MFDKDTHRQEAIAAMMTGLWVATIDILDVKFYGMPNSFFDISALRRRYCANVAESQIEEMLPVLRSRLGATVGNENRRCASMRNADFLGAFHICKNTFLNLLPQTSDL